MPGTYSSLRESGLPRRGDLPRAVRAILLLWAAALLAAIVAAPVAASAVRPEGWFLYQAFAALCHQQPGRSWHLLGYPLAVCVRCVGMYAGLLLAALVGVRLPVWTIALSSALLGASWAGEFTGLAAASSSTRFMTGLVLGGSTGAVVLAASLRRSRRTENASAPPSPLCE